MPSSPAQAFQSPSVCYHSILTAYYWVVVVGGFLQVIPAHTSLTFCSFLCANAGMTLIPECPSQSSTFGSHPTGHA